MNATQQAATQPPSERPALPVSRATINRECEALRQALATWAALLSDRLLPHERSVASCSHAYAVCDTRNALERHLYGSCECHDALGRVVVEVES